MAHPRPSNPPDTAATAGTTLPQLTLVNTTNFAIPVTAGHVASNPAIGLTATAGEGSTALCVWRAADDQLVSKLVERGRKVEGLRWKGDGMFFFSFFFFFFFFV
ncbi:hypothetical protein BT67DRAFT_373021 [Trichocladium antarcticum]|uniref:Uncharacterized protein n=1 Tax=Trichocladium antarcticum TaxID=1450529 RepID=A0AAN6UQ50_9PEZI|nr:hypothetical protein BT67DRAFT_373021 [Trichocladium antarcticum]